MSGIKIFVSHRIDINSELVDNPLYVPVRCGAVFDSQNPMGIPGEDTGDNISDRRMSFCEFTVQYWAWKNVQAEYYGLCHYRRYLSFAPKRFKIDEAGMIYVPVMTEGSKRKYGLLNARAMEQEIRDYDILVSEYAPVKNIPTPRGKQETVRAMWEAHEGVFFDDKAIELLFRLIDESAPEYSASAREYFAGGLHRGYNCYILKRDLFFRLCEFQFPIMFEVERRLDTTGYTQTMRRTPAFLGEMLYGIFIYHITTREQWRVKQLQLVYFRDTGRLKNSGDLFKRVVWAWIDLMLRAIIDPIMPKGSRQREFLKKIYYRVTPAKQRGVANIEL
ncbi:MAG: DUF4422 domain-containing protein [Oscillibacter sp.]|nr:DUF4422 domain-containing protein [Oscillibacter sp.]